MPDRMLGNNDSALEKGVVALGEERPAIAGEDWRFIDMEHSPFSAERLRMILSEMDQDRDATGRLLLAPLVRIPQDGDEDFRWAVKQVLDLGAFGVILPHVDTREEAVRLVRAMRLSPDERRHVSQSHEGSEVGDQDRRFGCGVPEMRESITAGPTYGR